MWWKRTINWEIPHRLRWRHAKFKLNFEWHEKCQMVTQYGFRQRNLFLYSSWILFLVLTPLFHMANSDASRRLPSCRSLWRGWTLNVATKSMHEQTQTHARIHVVYTNVFVCTMPTAAASHEYLIKPFCRRYHLHCCAKQHLITQIYSIYKQLFCVRNPYREKQKHFVLAVLAETRARRNQKK